MRLRPDGDGRVGRGGAPAAPGRCLATATGYPVYQAKAQLFLGQVTGRRGRWDKALGRFETALQLVMSYGDEVGRATVQVSLGRALMEVGRLDEASQILEDAVRVHRHHGNLPAERVALQRLHELRTRHPECAPDASAIVTGKETGDASVPSASA